jgi:hypothetical protein
MATVTCRWLKLRGRISPPPPGPASSQNIGYSDHLQHRYWHFLVWLEHLVGDVHQPLHATSRFSVDLPAGDRGGNSVALCASPCRNELHAFWDNVLGTGKSATTAITAADKLAAPTAARAAIADDQVWIMESFEAAKQFVYASPVGPGGGPYTLDAAYKSRAKTEVKDRIELAGARLANLINANLK